jgi:hypothetical protein
MGWGTRDSDCAGGCGGLNWSQEHFKKCKKMDAEEEESVEGPEGGWVPGMC